MAPEHNSTVEEHRDTAPEHNSTVAEHRAMVPEPLWQSTRRDTQVKARRSVQQAWRVTLEDTEAQRVYKWLDLRRTD